MKALIVNADDFGMCQAVNQGVAVAHEKGIVTSASLMVRRAAASAAADYAGRHPELSVGLHLDLGEWEFHDGGWHARYVMSGAVDAEVERQLDLFRELLGRDPTHLDSHQHAHRTEPAASVICVMAGRLGVPLRGTGAGIRYVGDFYGQTGRGDPLPNAISVEALLRLLGAMPEGVTELGCHPGIGNMNGTPYVVERAIEVETLCHPQVRAALEASGIMLASFADIRGMGVTNADS